MKTIPFLSMFATAAALVLPASSVRAQWSDQAMLLKAGWNAVYLHVDASYATLNELVGSDDANPIEEIWLWRPDPSTLQFIDSPQVPTGGTPWASWVRTLGPTSELQRLIGNAGYLVRVAAGAADYSWTVRGHPLAPRHDWTTSGLNFIGFPTAAPAPSFDSFLMKAPELQQAAEIFAYAGGELGAGNPARVFNLRTREVRRGEAFWIRTGSVYNRYYAPFETVLQSGSGFHFGTATGQQRFRLRNLVAEPLTVTVQLVASEAPPAGEEALAGTPPLLVRGELDTATLVHAFDDLGAGPRQWVLAAAGQPGSDIEVVLGMNRFAMGGVPGSLHAGVLRFTDSLGFSRVEMGVSARTGSPAGLWVGDAAITQVRHYLKNYERDADGQPELAADGRYVVSEVNTDLGTVARPFPLRLILHSDPDGENVALLQRVYFGLRHTNIALVTQESLLDTGTLGSARRISAVHLPHTRENAPWPFQGELRQGSSVAGTVTLAHDDQSSNPFLHTYHPDHDNLDATFTEPLARGEESYAVSRDITLRFTAPEADFASLTEGGAALGGVYEELITVHARGSESRQFEVRGAFALTRMAEIPVLTTP